MLKPARICFFPEPVLRTACEIVRRFDSELLQCVNLLDVTMRAQKHGIGIAAPQIGISKRVALVDLSSRIPNAKRYVLVNPEILDHGGLRLSREGCMSLPDYTADLRRYDWVRLKWQDELGHFHEQRFEGIESVCVQHEVDHLKGVLFLDRVACLKTDMYPRAVKGRKNRSVS